MSNADPMLACLEAAGHTVCIEARPYRGAGARSHRRGWYTCQIRVDPPLPRVPSSLTPKTTRLFIDAPSADAARDEALAALVALVGWIADEHARDAAAAEAEIGRLRVRAAASRAVALNYRPRLGEQPP